MEEGNEKEVEKRMEVGNVNQVATEGEEMYKSSEKG